MPGAIREELGRSSTHKRTVPQSERAASWRANRQHTPISPELSTTLQNTSIVEAADIVGYASVEVQRFHVGNIGQFRMKHLHKKIGEVGRDTVVAVFGLLQSRQTAYFRHP